MSATQIFRLHVDPEKCQGHNRCKSIAPNLFQLDAYGNAQAAGDGLVSPDQLERARLAQKNCPEYAIHLGRAS